MMSPRTVRTALAALALLVAAGCSTVDKVTGEDAAQSPTPASNGVADKPPAEILAAARSALAGAKSVHVKGNGTDEGEVYALDMRIQGTKGGRGTVTVKHAPVEILRIGETAYMKGSAEFWKALTGDRAAVELLKGKYLKTRADDPDLTELLAFTDARELGTLLLKPDGVVTLADRRKVGDVETVGLTFSTKGDEHTVYVATTGPAYPMYLSATGATADETSALDFLDYDKPFQVTPPAADLVVDVAKLK